MFISLLQNRRLYLLPLMFSPEAFAVISLNYLPPEENPPSACAVFYTRGEQFSNLCSGNIVGKDKLLTAGHCAPQDDEAAYIHCPHSKGREMWVKGFLVHSRYTAESAAPFDQAEGGFNFYTTESEVPFDLALLQTERDFFNFAPVPLPKNDKEMRSLINEGECVIYGYGRDSLRSAGKLRGGPVSAELKEFHNRKIFDFFGGKVRVGMNGSGFEMAVVWGDSAPVRGDSGGGVYCGKNGRYVQTGVMNKNGDSAVLGAFGLAVPVSTAIRDWIERHLEEDLPLYAGWPGRGLTTLPP